MTKLSSDTIDLAGLFTDAKMFDSEECLKRAGFEVIKWGPGHPTVARHPRAPGLLFKKHADDMSISKQLDNYRERISGADAVRQLIGAHHLKHIIVPRKRLHELNFLVKGNPSYMLICDDINLLTSRESKIRYENLDDETLREVCLIVYKFRGLDSGVHNIPFAASGQIAFIDTEKWRRKSDRHPLKRIKEFLSDRSRKLAKQFIRELAARDIR